MKNFIFLFVFSLFGFLESCSGEKPINTSQIVFPENLEGVHLKYQYEGGRGYHVKMEKAGLSYQFRTGGKPETWWGPFEYQVLKTNKGDYVIGWYERGYGDYITLTVDFEKKTLIGSGIIMPNSYIHFDRAKISAFEVNGQSY